MAVARGLGGPLQQQRALASTATSPIGTAGAVTGAAAVRSVGAAVSATEPQDWHSPQRPTHFAVSQPHSEQR